MDITKLVCTDCREKNPSMLSCIHTFGPRKRKPLADNRDEDLRAVREMVELNSHGV